MSTKHAIAAARFLENKENEAWHDHTLWMVRTKRDKMSHSLPEWDQALLQQPSGHASGGVREKRDRQRGYRALGERCRGA